MLTVICDNPGVLRAEQRSVPETARQLDDLARKLRDQFLDQQIQAVRQKMGTSAISAEDLAKLFAEWNQLKILRAQPLQAMGED